MQTIPGEFYRLSLVAPGEVTMHAPIDQDDLLVGYPRPDKDDSAQLQEAYQSILEPIKIVMGSGYADISRLSKAPINVAWVKRTDRDTGEVTAKERILTAPIGKISLTCLDPRRYKWGTEMAVPTSKLSILTELCVIVGLRVHWKQNKDKE